MPSATLDVEALHELVSEAQRGSRPAADRMVREHDAWVRSVVYGVTGRIDLVDDIAQQVWAQAWERLETLREPRRLRSWLYTIARNAAIDAGQARKRAPATGLESFNEPVADGQGRHPLRLALGDELRQTLRQAVEALPALYREPFVLRHLEDWSYAKIGDVLGMPVETVETRLVRARRLLREMLAGKVAS